MTLEERLAWLSEDVRFVEAPEMAKRITAEIGPREAVPKRFPIRTFVSVAAACLLLFSLLIPSVRAQIEDWIELPGFIIERVDELPPDSGIEIDSSFMIGDEIAIDSVEYLLLSDSTIDTPEAAYQRVDATGTVTSFIYAPDSELPEIGESGVGALLMIFHAETDVFPAVKQSEQAAELLELHGVTWAWIEQGNLSMYPYDPGDLFNVSEVSRATGNVLIWESNGMTWRLETSLSLEEAVAFAMAIAPVD